MLKLAQAIVVEGRYDQNTLAQLVDAPIFVTNGFGIFRDREQMELLKLVAEKRGLVVFTDSDGAGLVIRNRIRSAIPPQYLLHAYIPDIYGKEKRKAAPGKEGKLGVEGMKPEVLIAALRNAGAIFLNEEPNAQPSAETSAKPPYPIAGADMHRNACEPGRIDKVETITKSDLYELGLSGKPDSKEKRRALQKKLGLPENLSTNALLAALNCLYSKEEISAFLQ